MTQPGYVVAYAAEL